MSQVIAQPGVNMFSSEVGSLIPSFTASFFTKALLKSGRIMADAWVTNFLGHAPIAGRNGGRNFDLLTGT